MSVLYFQPFLFALFLFIKLLFLLFDSFPNTFVSTNSRDYSLASPSLVYFRHVLVYLFWVLLFQSSYYIRVMTMSNFDFSHIFVCQLQSFFPSAPSRNFCFHFVQNSHHSFNFSSLQHTYMYCTIR